MNRGLAKQFFIVILGATFVRRQINKFLEELRRRTAFERKQSTHNEMPDFLWENPKVYENTPVIYDLKREGVPDLKNYA